MNQIVLGIRTALISFAILHKYIKEIALLSLPIIVIMTIVTATQNFSILTQTAGPLVHIMILALMIRYLFAKWDQKTTSIFEVNPLTLNILLWMLIAGIVIIALTAITEIPYRLINILATLLTYTAPIIGTFLNYLVIPHLLQKGSFLLCLKQAANTLKNHAAFVVSTYISQICIALVTLMLSMSIITVFFTKGSYIVHQVDTVLFTINSAALLFLDALLAGLMHRTVTNQASPASEFETRSMSSLLFQVVVTVLILALIISAFTLLTFSIARFFQYF